MVATLILKVVINSAKLHARNNVCDIIIGHTIRADAQSHKQTDAENVKQSTGYTMYEMTRVKLHGNNVHDVIIAHVISGLQRQTWEL